MSSNILISKPTFEHHHSGLGVERARPRISWRFSWRDDTPSNWQQTKYEIEVTIGDATLHYHVESSQSVLVPWPAQDLQPQQSATVRVRCCGTNEEHTEWSEPGTVETALLGSFKAHFITSAVRGPAKGPLRPLRFRKDFYWPDSYGKPSKARLYITALGIFNAYVDGHRANGELDPGWTSYKHRLTYRTIDVTPLLQSGERHTLCVEVAEGWYAGRLGFNGGHRYLYGDSIAMAAQLDLTFDENEISLISDDSWVCADSAISKSEFYNGEIYNAAKEWNWTGLATDNDQWSPTKTITTPDTKLCCSEMPPVRIVQSLTPKEILKTPSGRTVIDFGQNLVGKVRLKSFQIPCGQTIIMRHAEVMDQNELGIRPLRHARAEDVYISSGEACSEWTPAFAFHGFRYVQVDGPIDPSHIEALVIHTDMTRRGHFSCSNEWVNRLHENVVWSMRGNFVSIPTDCPQRDERLGWTGDIQVFTPTASFLFDTTSFLSSWLEDLMAEQLEKGRGGIPPLVVPILPLGSWPHMPAAVWDDATVLVPSGVFNYSGDTEILKRQLPSMRAWIDQGVDRGEDGLWNRDRWQLGDWLDPTAPPEDPGASRTDFVLVADAYLINVTQVLSDVCVKLDKLDLAEGYAADSTRLSNAFRHKYITPGGHLMSNTQTGLALAIQFGLYPGANEIAVASKELVKQVRYAVFRINTGFAGTPVILPALTSIHESQLAYRMLLETTCPSWLYSVSMGATTIWERWNSMLPDGSINPGEMTSFNHYALGSVADWLHTTVGGISPAEPGWKVIRVRPVPGGNLTYCDTSFDGPYGLVSCSWKLSDSDTNGACTFEMTLCIPPNSTAIVTLPSELRRSVTATEEESSRTVGSGQHTFKCDWAPDLWPPRALYSLDRGEDDTKTIAHGSVRRLLS